MDEIGKITEVSWQPNGGELLGAHASGVSSLILRDASDFNESGGLLSINGQEIAYSSVTFETDTVVLAAPTTAAAEDGEYVYVVPYGEDKWASVEAPSVDEDSLRVRVPHDYQDLLVDGIRDENEQETVILTVDDQSGLWTIDDIIGTQARRSGDYIDPDTVPGNGPDGLPPAISPAINLVGGIGALHGRWTPIDNNDPVLYQVHISISDGFLPVLNGPTLSVETAGSSYTIRTMPDGSPLQYGVTYYARIIAMDEDTTVGNAPVAGAQDSATLVEITNEDIAASFAYIGTLVADQITGGSFNADLLLASIIRTSNTGARVEFGPFGITIYASDGKPAIVLPSDLSADNPATFNGEGEFDALTARGVRIEGMANEVAAGGVLRMGLGVSAPEITPTHVLDYETVQFDLDPAYTIINGLQWNAATSEWLLTVSAPSRPDLGQVQRYSTAGVRLGTYVPTIVGQVGATIMRNSVLIGANLWYLWDYTSSTTANAIVLHGTATSFNYTSKTANSIPFLTTDGTNLVIVDRSGNNYSVERRNPTTGALISTVTFTAPSTTSGQVAGAVQAAVSPLVTPWSVVTMTTTAVNVFETVGTAYPRRSDYEFTTNGKARGFASNGTNFFSIDSGGKLSKYETGNFWTTESSVWYGGITWRDVTGTVHETIMGPAKQFPMSKRARLKLSVGDIPVGTGESPDAVGFYLARGATLPARTAFWRQTSAVGEESITVTSASFSGTNPPDPANNTLAFPATGYGSLTSAGKDGSGNPKIDLRGDGTYRLDPNGNLEDTDWVNFDDGVGEVEFADSGATVCRYRRIGKSMQVEITKATIAARDTTATTSGDFVNRNITSVGAVPSALRPSSPVPGEAYLDNAPTVVNLNAAGTAMWLGGLPRNYPLGSVMVCKFSYLLP